MGFDSVFKGLKLSLEQKFTRFGKGKGHPLTGHESPGVVWRYTSTLSLTSALDGVGGQRHVPAALPPGKSRYPL